MSFKDPTDRAAIMNALISDIFDLTSQVYDTISKQYAERSASGESFEMQVINSNLNFSAMIIDFGLADIFSGILAIPKSQVSSSIKLSSTGDMIFTADNTNMSATIKKTDVKTATPAIQQGAYTVDMIAAVVGIASSSVNFGLDIATAAKKGQKKSKEAL
jgi:hypothetical protein